MKQIAAAILRKEIREVLRDKRTLFLALFLPLLFYPALMGVSISVSKESAKGAVKEKVVVFYDRSGTLFENGFSAVTDKKEDSMVVWREWSDPEKSRKGEVSKVLLPAEADAGLFWNEDTKVYQLFWRSTPKGAKAKRLLSVLLEKVRERLIEKELAKSGLELSAIEPFKLQEVNVTPVREQVGRKMGGVGAYFMIFLAFTGCMSVAVDAGAGERERGTMEAMMLSPASFMGIAIGKFLFVLLMGGLSVLATFIGMGSMLLFDERARVMAGEFVDMESMAMLMVLMLGVVFVFASALYCIALMAKSAREAHLRSSLVMMILAVALIMSGSEMVNSSVWVKFVPVMNTSVAISHVISGVADWFFVGLCLLFSVLFGVLLLWYVSLIFKRIPERSYLTE